MTGTAGVLASAPAPVAPPPIPRDFGTCVECAANCLDCGNGCVCNTPAQDPSWNPPFSSVGKVGYRRNTEPLCASPIIPFGLDVWSDGSTVYALVSGTDPGFGGSFNRVIDIDQQEDAGVTAKPEATLGGSPAPEQGGLTQLWANDGRHWRLALNAVNASTDYGVRGAPSAWVAVHDRGVAPGSEQFIGPQPITTCTLGMLEGRSFECLDLDPVHDMVVVTRNLAHVLSGDQRILTYDGERWHGVTPLLPFPASRLWADERSLLAVGRNGSVMWLEGDRWRAEDLGTVEHFTAVFGTSRTDIWAGTRQGTLFHYDGTSWTERGRLVPESCDHRLPITHIWGSGDQVYFTTPSQFARWNGGTLESLGGWQCNPTDSNNLGSNALSGGRAITGMWGNAPDEVFLAMVDTNVFGDRCAKTFIVRFDGKQFHRM